MPPTAQTRPSPASRGRSARAALAGAALLITGGCLSPAQHAGSHATAEAPAAQSAPAFTELELEVHHAVNRRRAAAGLAPLRMDARVSEIARRHSAAMAAGRVSLGHAGIRDRANALHRILSVAQAGENVAAVAARRWRASVATVASWENSRRHRAAMYGRFHVTGVGVARSEDGVFYITQLYVRTR